MCGVPISAGQGALGHANIPHIVRREVIQKGEKRKILVKITNLSRESSSSISTQMSKGLAAATVKVSC